MPIFDYLCKKCHHRFERFVQGQERPKCPKCTSSRLQQQPTVFAQGRVRGVRSLNSPSAMAHLRRLIGPIPTIPNHVTRTTNPGRRSRRSTMTAS
jgi:putative FmdB family regulatory protein